LEWEWRPKSSSCPPGFLFWSCDFRSPFFPIFVHGFDLDFPEFGSISDNDFLGIGSCPVEFHLCKVWECFVLITIRFRWILGRPFFCSSFSVRAGSASYSSLVWRSRHMGSLQQHYQRRRSGVVCAP
jgi:hypothetical protein